MTTQLTKSSDELTIRAYFEGVLQLAQSDEQYPVSLDEVWPLVYSTKGHAVRELTNNFIEDVDYQVFTQNGKNLEGAQETETAQGGRPANEYRLTTACLEYFIARKVRPVFEVYRAVFHKAAMQAPKNLGEALRLAADLWDKNQEQRRQIQEQTLLIAEKTEAINAKDAIIADQSNCIAQMQEKVSYLDCILASKDALCMSQIAQDYGMSAKKLNAILCDLGVQRKVGGQWILYAKYLPCGYTVSETITFTRADGTEGTKMHTKWRQKGRIFLYELLKANDVLPLIEK